MPVSPSPCTSPSLSLAYSVIFMHCCIVKYFAFNCTRTALQSRAVFRPYLHGKYFAVQQQQQQPAEWAGFVMAICICHGSFPIFFLPPLPPLCQHCICRHLAPFYWLRRFWAHNFCLHSPACQAARLPAWTESTRFDSLCVVLCVVFGTFSTKHFTLFIFATIALRFQVAFEVFVLSVGAQFHQCCPCRRCCLCIHISHVYLWH